MGNRTRPPCLRPCRMPSSTAHFGNRLAVRDALRLDYKSFETSTTGGALVSVIGVSTVLLSMDDFLQKGDDDKKNTVLADIRSYMEERKIEFLGIMLTSSTDAEEGPPLRRQLILCASNSTAFSLSDMVQHLQKPDSPLQLTELVDQAVTDQDGLTLRFFDQGNPKASRKQVAPLLLEFFETTASK